jgi:FlaA1/EpsC-like NDP-sugar epimerase
MFKNKRILITGGTGSWGKALIKRLLLENPKEIRIFSRNEFLQVQTKRDFNNSKLNFIIGDLRDEPAVNKSCIKIDYIFHLGALKHIILCEQQPMEAIKTNIIGTQNIILGAINNKVKKVIDVSSDKSVSPTNTYGATKMIGEKLILNANNFSNTKFICIRAGNVMGTSGSIIPFFIDKINKKESLPITNLQMTRFYMSLEQAMNLLIKASIISRGGEIMVTKMSSCKIIDLTKCLSYPKKLKYHLIGMFPGEKLHEMLISEDESIYTKEYDKNYYIILASLNYKKLIKYYFKYPDFKLKKYASNTFLMNEQEIVNLLRKGGFISE